MRNIWWTFIAILVVVLAALYIDLPGTHDFFGRPVTINQGIDLAGGARVLYCTPKGTNPSSGDMSTARDVIQSRASGGYGVTEPQVTQVGNNCISVELPGVKNAEKAISTIGATGFLALTDSGNTYFPPGTKVKLVCKVAGCAKGYPVGQSNLSAKTPVMQIIVPGTEISRGWPHLGIDQNNNDRVNFNMTGAGQTAWRNYTTNQHNPNQTAPTGAYSAIVLDNQVVSDPNVQGPICGSNGTQITGLTGTSEAQKISVDLNYGALPVQLRPNSLSTVAASLGAQSVTDAKKAGVIGLIIVALFMLLYYRLPGLLADIALLMYAAFVFAAFKLLGVTMTLAGIAGFILSIGMAVDANVLIFERMKEELRSGKTLGAAVESGFRRAWPSIRDSNASTIITTIILFWFGHNFAATEITGFATTLFLGVVISLLTAVFVSHTFLRLLVISGRWRSPQLFGVEPQTASPRAGGSLA